MLIKIDSVLVFIDTIERNNNAAQLIVNCEKFIERVLCLM